MVECLGGKQKKKFFLWDLPQHDPGLSFPPRNFDRHIIPDPLFTVLCVFFPRISLLEHDVMFPKSIINVGAWRSVSLFGCYSTGSETVRHDEDGRAPFFFATETYFPLLQSFQL